MINGKGTKGQTTIYKAYTETKDRTTRTPLKTGGELACSGRVSSFCSTSGTCRVTLVTNPVISHECKIADGRRGVKISLKNIELLSTNVLKYDVWLEILIRVLHRIHLVLEFDDHMRPPQW